MRPEFTSFLHIGSYSVLLLAGFFFGWLLARYRAGQAGLEKRHVDNITLILVVAGVAGARLFSRLFYMPNVGFFEAFMLWKGGGLVFYGGFIVCVIAVIIYSLYHKLPMVRFMDALAPSVATGLAFGRIGCFLAGCCWGDICISHSELSHVAPATLKQVQTLPAISGANVPFAVTFPRKSDIYKQHAKLGVAAPDAPRSRPVHPVQLYESALAFLLCYLLHKAKDARLGSVSIGLLMGYSLIRFSSEFLRADNKPIYWGMTLSQVISLCLAVISLVWLLVRRQRNRPSESPHLREFNTAPTINS